MAPVTELFALLDALDDSDSTVTSFRQPAALRDAVRLAVELGLAGSSNEVAVTAIRSRVEAFAQSLALEEHFAAHPHARPSLGDLAIAAAELDGHPLADQHDFLRSCADEVAAIRTDANSEDVLLYATGRRLLAEANRRNLRRAGRVVVIVPTTVRVEAGRDRTDPVGANANRLARPRDHVLDTAAANRAAQLRAAANVSVVDACVAQAAQTAPGPVAVITSDPDDMVRLGSLIAGSAQVRVVAI